MVAQKQYFWRNNNGQMEIVQKITYLDNSVEWFKFGSELEFYDHHIPTDSIIEEILPPA